MGLLQIIVSIILLGILAFCFIVAPKPMLSLMKEIILTIIDIGKVIFDHIPKISSNIGDVLKATSENINKTNSTKK